VQPRRLTYADAVRLLAGRDIEVVEWLGRAVGVPAAAATIASLGTGREAGTGLCRRPGEQQLAGPPPGDNAEEAVLVIP